MADQSFERFARGYDAGRAQIVFQRVVADLETPIGAYLKLSEGRQNTFLLESVQDGATKGRYSMIGFAMGAMLAGLVGGLLVAITGINLGMGGPTSVKAFLMIMIGGAGVISGAIAGGFILGMMESIGLTVLAAYGDITYLVIFATLMIFLAIRPQGLMGKPWG